MPLRHHRTVDRVTRILELAAARPDGITISEAAKALDAPISSIQGFVNGLVAAGYLDEDTKRYRLGPGAYILTMRANRNPAGVVQHAHLEALHRQTRCHILLAVRVGDAVVYIDEVHSARQFSTRLLSQKRSLLDTVAGHIFLSRMRPEEVESILGRETDDEFVERILDELAEPRETGVLVRLESWKQAGASVGVAVEDADGYVVGVVVANTTREDLEPRVNRVVKALKQARAEWATRR